MDFSHGNITQIASIISNTSLVDPVCMMNLRDIFTIMTVMIIDQMLGEEMVQDQNKAIMWAKEINTGIDTVEKIETTPQMHPTKSETVRIQMFQMIQIIQITH